MKQVSIMEQAKRMGDTVYAHELSVGDTVALTMSAFRKRQPSEVTACNFESNGFGDFSGSVDIKTKTWNKSKGIFITKTKTVKNPKTPFIFINTKSN